MNIEQHPWLPTNSGAVDFVMKTFRFLLVSFLICSLVTVSALAQSSTKSVAVVQDYHNAIGARLGGLTSGLTFKHFGKPQGAFEGILSFGYRTFLITALYEQHNTIANAPGLRWFYGGGGHIGFFRYGGYYYWMNKKNGKFIYVDGPGDRSRAVVGLDFIIGLDYKFKDAPFDLSLDLKPFVDFWDGPYGYFDGALSARFTF
jgi:hypothetical protein